MRLVGADECVLPGGSMMESGDCASGATGVDEKPPLDGEPLGHSITGLKAEPVAAQPVLESDTALGTEALGSDELRPPAEETELLLEFVPLLADEPSSTTVFGSTAKRAASADAWLAAASAAALLCKEQAPCAHASACTCSLPMWRGSPGCSGEVFALSVAAAAEDAAIERDDIIDEADASDAEAFASSSELPAAIGDSSELHESGLALALRKDELLGRCGADGCR